MVLTPFHRCIVLHFKGAQSAVKNRMHSFLLRITFEPSLVDTLCLVVFSVVGIICYRYADPHKSSNFLSSPKQFNFFVQLYHGENLIQRSRREALVVWIVAAVEAVMRSIWFHRSLWWYKNNFKERVSCNTQTSTHSYTHEMASPITGQTLPPNSSICWWHMQNDMAEHNYQKKTKKNEEIKH